MNVPGRSRSSPSPRGPRGRGLGWVARIDMGNTLSTHMGNTSIVCREISPVPQELLHTSSQAPKGPIDGVCDEVCSSSASRKKCVAGRRRAQKVLPMSMRIVLPMSMRRAVRASPLPTAWIRLSGARPSPGAASSAWSNALDFYRHASLLWMPLPPRTGALR